MMRKIGDLVMKGVDYSCAFHPKFGNLVMDKGALACNRCQWMRIKGMEGGEIGILNYLSCQWTMCYVERVDYFNPLIVVDFS